MKRKALQMTEVWHRYGNTTAVENLSIVLHEGEVVCLLGPSGCGKSTALRIAAGLERLQKGVVELDEDVAESDDDDGDDDGSEEQRVRKGHSNAFAALSLDGDE